MLRSRLVYLVLLGVGWTLALDGASMNESSPTLQPPADSSTTPSPSPQLRPIDKGLRPLYVMTDTFLNVVQPESRGYFIDDQRFNAVFTSPDLRSGFRAFQDNAQDWQFWARHYIGYSVCVAFGVVFIVVMPIVGLCVCCCRCAGHCGGSRGKYDHRRTIQKHDGCRRAACSLLLLILTTLITAGMVCAFVTNQMVHDQTTNDNNQRFDAANDNEQQLAVVSAVKQVVYNLQLYQRTTTNELRTTLLPSIYGMINYISSQLHGFPAKARDRLSEVTKSLELLNVTAALADSLYEISRELKSVSELTSSLQQQQQQLNDSLMASKQRLLASLGRCAPSIPKCNTTLQSVRQMQLSADYMQFENITQQLSQIQRVIDSDFKVKIQQAQQDYSNISVRVLNLVEDKIRDYIVDADRVVNDTVKSVTEQVQTVVDRAVEVINSVNLSTVSDFMDKDIAPHISTYGNYRYYVCIALSCILLLIVAFLYFGLCFGACGDAVSRDAGVCNRGVGARLLLAGVGFTFLFCWVLMIAVVVLFITGGATYTELCRPISNPQPQQGLVKLMNWAIYVEVREQNISLTYTGLLDRCESNEGLYSALNLERVYSLASKVDKLKSDVRASMNDLMSRVNTSITDDVNILTPEVESLLRELMNSGLDNINFTSFDVVLSSSVLAVNLSEVIQQLNNTANSMPPSTERNDLLAEANYLQSVADNNISKIQNTSSSLRQVLLSLKRHVQPGVNDTGFMNRTRDLIVALNNTQMFIRVNGSVIIQQFVVSFVNSLYSSTVTFLSQLMNQVQRGIGRCRPLYSAVQTVTTAVCQTFLSPFNGFWFSVGWCLAFLLPTIVIALHLAGLYLVTDDFNVSDNKSYDESRKQLLTNLKNTAHSSSDS